MAVAKASLQELQIRDFSGGPNIRDAASELAKNEEVDSWNVEFDERGGVGSRLGMSRYNPTPFGGGLVSNVYYSPTLQKMITQAGASLYVDTTTTAVKTFTTSARATFADFAGKIVACHPIDGLFTSTDGTTWTAVSDPDAPKGSCVEVWQNQLYVAGQTANPARVSWSDAGDPTAWTATKFNDLRTLNNEQVLALKVASGLDVSGRAGLLAFKRKSTYRLYDTTTGAYEVVDAAIGTASALSVVSVGSRTVSLSERGIFWWQEGSEGMHEASDKLDPLWTPQQINNNRLDLFCGGRWKDRARFSLPRAGSTANDLALDYNVDGGWIAPSSNAVSAYTLYEKGTNIAYGGSPTVTGVVMQLDAGGTDDGAAIPSRIQSRWWELNEGFLAQLWKLSLFGRGSQLTLTIRKDYADSGGDTYTVNFGSDGPRYDSGIRYDIGILYASPARQYPQHIYSIGPCRQFSFILSATSTATGFDLPIFGLGVGPVSGAWSLYQFGALHVPLGIA